MDIKSKIATVLFTGIFAAGIVAGSNSAVYAKDKNAAKVVAPTEGVWKQSARYDYKILCPKEPLGVVPAKMFFNDNNKKGDVIIFETFGGDIYNVKTAWVVLTDAFPADAFPDLTKLSDEECTSLTKKIQESNGYLFVSMVDLPEKNKGIYAVTAKEIEIDEDNDGKVDGIAKSDTQTAVTFFRGQYGGRFCVQLIDNPDIRESAIVDYKNGVLSLTELKPDSNDKKKSKGKTK